MSRALVAAAALAVVAPRLAWAQGPPFHGPQSSAGPGPVHASAGDLDNDGKNDLVVMSFEGTLALLLGNGDQTFGPPTSHAYGGSNSNPSNVALGDFTNDGKIDMAAAIGLGTLKLIPGNGAGGFSPETTVTVGGGARSVRLADLDADGMLDAVFARSGYGLVGVLMNNGAPGFGASLTFASAGNSTAVAVGDVNGDGRLDLVATSAAIHSGLSVLLGIPSPTGPPPAFAPHVDFPLAGGPIDLALADFDHDGDLDVATANSYGDSASFLPGNGLGAFGAPTTVSFPTESVAIRLGDVNGDLHTDAVLTSNGGRVSLLLGSGTGAFLAPTTYDLPSSTGATPADFDADGRDEVLVSFHAIGGTNAIALFASDSAGALPAPQHYSPVVGPMTDFAAGDVDGDGRLDLVIAGGGGFPPFLQGTLEVLIGTPSGAFATAVQVHSAPYFRLALADLTLDGNLDVVTSKFLLSQLDVLLGDGSGGFALTSTTAVPATNPYDVAVADIDGDGLPDAITSNGSANTLSIFFGDGAGGFTGFNSLVTGTFPLETETADLNGDGVLDIVSADNDASGISVFLGLGGGAFGPVVHHLSGTNTNGLRADDLDGDGDVDLAVASPLDVVFVFLGDGTGALTGPSQISFPFLTLVHSVTAGDVDGDGRRDLVTANLGAGSIAVLRGLGGATFAPPAMFIAAGAAEAVALADVDADGRPDAVVDASGKISVLRNALATPAGTAPYGTGTPGCGGILGFAANSSPVVGSATHGFVTTNAPRGALGLGIVTDLPDLAGSDPFSLGITLHVGIFGAGNVVAIDARSDSSGIGFAPAPIPNSPFLVGGQFYVQTLWVEALAQGEACGASPFHLVTSGAVHLTIQP